MILPLLLQQIGLTDKQARVYVACLELGSTTAQMIAKRSGVSRSTAYFILEELACMGLISFFDKEKIRHFTAEDPRRLFQETQHRMDTMERVFPELERLWGQRQSKTSVRFFEGLQNIKKMYDELLTLNLKEYWVFGSSEYWKKADEAWFTDYMRRRADAGIRICLLADDAPGTRWQMAYEKKIGGARVKIIPKKFTKMFPLTSDTTILPDRVIFQNYGREMTSVVLYSKEAADLMRLWFLMTWEMVK